MALSLISGASTALAVVDTLQPIVTGTISGTTLTVNKVASGNIWVGTMISGSGITVGTTILQQITSAEQTGALGGRGTYMVSASQSVSSTSITVMLMAFTATISTTTLTVSALLTTVSQSTLPSLGINAGQTLLGSGITAGTTIVAQLTGTSGRVGTYTVSNSMSIGAGQTMWVDTGNLRVSFYDIYGNYLPTSVGVSISPTVPIEAIPIGGINDGAWRTARLDRYGNIRLGFDQLLFLDMLEGTTINTAIWTQSQSGLTQALAQPGGINFNSTAATPAAGYSILTSQKQFFKMQQMPMRLRMRARISQVANVTTDFGFGNPATNVMPTMGASWRFDGTAILPRIAVSASTYTASIASTTMTVTAVTTGGVAINQLISGTSVTTGTTVVSQIAGTQNGIGTYVVSVSSTAASTTITGADIVGTDINSLISSSNYYSWEIIIHNNDCLFVVQDVSTGRSISEQVLNIPNYAPKILNNATHTPIFFRTSTGSAATPVATLSDTLLIGYDTYTNKPWGHTLATIGKGQETHPTTYAQSTQWANSSMPTATTPTSTAASYSTLGGVYNLTHSITTTTNFLQDFNVFGFQAPSPYSFYCTGVYISTFANVAWTAVAQPNLQWWVSNNATGTDLTAATSQQTLPAGSQYFAATVVVGAMPVVPAGVMSTGDVFVDFPVPLRTDPGKYLNVFYRLMANTNFPAGAATYTFGGAVTLKGYFE